ncbi:ectin [Drosophila subpulchrella]|uniref:ectin n=1 Tax=Drosophila subpulchrella TaxID=1486046 RepID=UPI0018A14421|nr:ectin [Drosophila subpulchrella]
MMFIKILIFMFLAASEVSPIYAMNMDNARIVLRDTNKRRKRHGSQPLALDMTLSDGCQKYANKLAKSANLTYSDPSNKEYTENICKYEISAGALSRCVRSWYSGRKFDVLDPRAKEFTALIWSSSQFMGYGDANINALQGVLVVRYTPPGNVPGLYTDNVRKKKKKDKKRKKKHKHRDDGCANRQGNRYVILLSILFVLLTAMSLDDVLLFILTPLYNCYWT